MTATVLTTAEVTSFIQAANDYIAMSPNYRNWCPVKPIPEGYIHTWYKINRVPRAQSSKDGRDYKDVQTARTSASANIVSLRYGFSLPRVAVEIAQQQGVPIWSENVGTALRHLEDQIAELIIEGSSPATTTYSLNVSISGMRDGGTDVGGTPDALLWSTVTKPLGHIAEAWAQLNTSGYTGRKYKWMLSSNLAPGLKAKYGAGDASHETLAKEDYDVEEIIYLPMGTTTELTTYPIGPATADDGVWFVFPKDEQVFYLAEVFAPKVAINPQLNEKTDSFEGYIHWRGTVAIVQATGIIYFPEVDLA